MREAPPTKTCLQYFHLVLVRLVFQLNDCDMIPPLPLFFKHFEIEILRTKGRACEKQFSNDNLP